MWLTETDTMKNICFLIGNLNSSGGTERVTSLITNELVQRHYNILILSLVDGSSPFFNLDKHIQTHTLYPKKISFKRNFVGAVWKIRQFLKNHKVNALVVVDSISCLFTVPATVGLDIKHLCWEHFNFKNNNGVRLRDVSRVWAARYCDYVITLTERDKELWKLGLNKIKANIIAIPNPTAYENIDHVSRLDAKVVLALGHLTPVKGFDLLIQAWSQVCRANNDWILCLLGSGEEEEALKNQAKSLNIADRIDFVAATKNVEQYYRACAFYCLSSRFEGLPMVLLEAQAFGLPIISFDCETGPSEVVVDNINGWLVDNGDVEALSERLLTAINIDNSTYQELSNQAKSSSQRFSVSHVVDSWHDILSDNNL